MSVWKNLDALEVHGKEGDNRCSGQNGNRILKIARLFCFLMGMVFIIIYVAII